MTTHEDLPGGEQHDEPQPTQALSAVDREELRRERARRARERHAELERERLQTTVAPPGAVADSEPAEETESRDHRSFKLTPPPEGSSEHRSFKLTTPPAGSESDGSDHRPFRLTR
jgi:hypothetical protein